MLVAMTGIRGMLGALLLCVVLSSCGGSDDETLADTQTNEPSEATSATPEASSSPTAAPDPVTMLEACPEVEAVLPNGFIPGFGKMNTYVDRLNELSELGDTETQNALQLLTPAATDLMLAVARNAQGSDLTDALRGHLDGLSAFGTRCAAAGSSALQ